MFTGAVLVQGFVNAALSAYLAGATYVLQDIYSLSPQQYALAFGLNSAGFMVFGYLAGRASERWSVTGTLAAGPVLCALGALGLLAAGLFALPLAAVIVSLLVMVNGVAATMLPLGVVTVVSVALAAAAHAALMIRCNAPMRAIGTRAGHLRVPLAEGTSSSPTTSPLTDSSPSPASTCTAGPHR
ncbi:hypothetical protein [Arthrobacter mobilis]|uniref:hypothetical protein n=1 Tax=Arthrobacter mobilis TaxID=2724944 RepID=UPI00197B6978|nr:hypothetical protein [Arthrobacter mobilis]